MQNINIYVGCALTFASEGYKKEIQEFKTELAKLPKVTILEFCPPPQEVEQRVLTPGEIYKNDVIDGIGKAHLVIAEVSLPSTGLGIELAFAIGQHHTTTIMYAKPDVHVSMLVQGFPAHYKHASFVRYRKTLIDQIPGIINMIEFVRAHRLKK